MELALKQCEARGVDFAEAFRFQYIISPVPLSPPGMKAMRFAKQHVYSGAALPVARLKDADGIVFAVLFGIAVDKGGLLTFRRNIEDLQVSDPDFFISLARYLEDVAGRYTLLVSVGDDCRVYCDAAGMNGVVYNKEKRCVAASLLLCLDDAIQDHPDYDHAQIEAGLAKYTLFDTRDSRVRRLNPNCSLSLTDFSETRYWPRDEAFERPASELPAIYSEIIATAHHNITAIAARHACAMPITGGRDSRLLAAFLKPDLGKVGQYYTHIVNYASRVDHAIATHVAKALGLKLKSHDFRRVSGQSNATKAQQLALYQTATGITAPAPAEVMTGVIRNIKRNTVILRGHQTDLLRAVFLDRRGEGARKNLRWQIRRLMPVSPPNMTNEIFLRFEPRYRAWCESLPPATRSKQVDLMFAEIYYSSSLGVVFPGLTRNFYLSPFNSRRLIALALAIDDEYRHQSKAVDDLVERMAPEVNRVPLDYEVSANLDLYDDPEMLKAWSKQRVKDSVARAAAIRGRAKPRANPARPDQPANRKPT